MYDFDWTFPYPSQRMPVLAANVVADLAAAGRAGRPAHAAQRRQRRRRHRRHGDRVDRRRADDERHRLRRLCVALGWARAARTQRLRSRARGLDAGAIRRPDLHAHRRMGHRHGAGRGVRVGRPVAAFRQACRSPTCSHPPSSTQRAGFLVSPTVARQWASQLERFAGQPGFAQAFMPGGRAPRAGERFRFPAQAATLEEIARSAGESFYRGATRREDRRGQPRAGRRDDCRGPGCARSRLGRAGRARPTGACACMRSRPTARASRH